jgi:CBS domain-containing protein
MQIQDVLKTKGSHVETITPDATLRQAVHQACARHIGALLVVDGEGQLRGIITERDILRQCDARADLDRVRVGDAMTSQLIIGFPEDDLQLAMNVMTQRRIRHLPILNDGKVVGLVSIGDIVKALHEEEEVEIRYLRDYITH